MSRKLIFLDVDGTLVDFTMHMPESAREALSTARKQGHLISLCTGRTVTNVYPWLLDFGFDAIVASAGAYVSVKDNVIYHSILAQDKVQELVDAYNAVGHVPFKEKDKIFKEYHDVLDKIYSDLHVSVARRRLDNFKQNLRNVAKRGEDAMDNERGRLTRRYEQLKQEIATYENNLGFLNISSKKGNSLVDEMNRKVQRLKDDAELVRQKIKAIDSQDNN